MHLCSGAVVLLLAATCTTTSPATSSQGPRCDVLCISDAVVEPGQKVRVTFEPPKDHIWGVDAELRPLGEERIAWLYGFVDDPELKTVWPSPNLGFEGIGFYGRGEWTWTVPIRLEPGSYRLVKQAISDAAETLDERTREWSVTLEVTS